MRMLDLFSGIGGFSLAASWVWGDELEIVAFCEIDKFCQKVLKKHWPMVPIINDIREVTGERITAYTNERRCSPDIREEIPKGEDTTFSYTQPCSRNNGGDTIFGESIDLLTGGFPCQPFSCAGKRKGRDDDRFLWPEMLRVIRELHPTWVLAENVGGLYSQQDGMVFGQVLSDLEAQGYEVQPFLIPACSVNAPHRRDRVWIVANAQRGGFHGKEIPIQSRESRQAHTDLPGPQGQDEYGQRAGERTSGQGHTEQWEEDWYTVALRTCSGGVHDGLPRRMDRVDRLKALGNSIVPQVAYEIMKAIRQAGILEGG